MTNFSSNCLVFIPQGMYYYTFYIVDVILRVYLCSQVVSSVMLDLRLTIAVYRHICSQLATHTMHQCNTRLCIMPSTTSMGSNTSNYRLAH